MTRSAVSTRKAATLDASCTDCHTKHVWIVTSRQSCLTCHDDKKDHNAPTFCGDCHEFKASPRASSRPTHGEGLSNCLIGPCGAGPRPDPSPGPSSEEEESAA